MKKYHPDVEGGDEEIAKEIKRVLVVSLELSKEELVNRVI